MAPREKLLDRLRKLRAMAEGAAAVGNQAEAEAFAAKVQDLLTEHKLSMTDVDLAEQEVDDPLGWVTQEPPRAHRRRMFWLERLASAVADAHFCHLIMTKDWSTSHEVRYIFVGRKSDVALATWVFTVLAEAAHRLSALEYRAARAAGIGTRGFHTAFHLAYSTTIAQRYADERERLERGLRVAGTGLVRLDTARAEAAAFAADNFVTEKSSTSVAIPDNAHALARGAHHGRAANLNGTALGGAPDAARRLGTAPRALPAGRST